MRPSIRMIRVTLLALVPALAAARASVEEADWPLFRGDAALRGVARTTLPQAPTLLWTFECGKAITSSPVVSEGRVYFGADDQLVHCLDLESGEQRWTFPTEDVIEAPPLCFEGRVYVGSADATFYALDAADGSLAWKFATGDRILGGANALPAEESRPARVVVGSYDGKLYCFDAAKGDLVWSYTTANYVNGTPAIDGERIVFGGCDAVLHVVRAGDGEKIAQVELGSESHVAGSVAVEDGRVYFGHYGNTFVCVDLAGGETVWRYEDPKHAFFSSPALTPERVLFG